MVHPDVRRFVQIEGNSDSPVACLYREGATPAAVTSVGPCRNFLKSYAVWWFPPMVLQMAAFVLSAAWGVLAFLIYWLTDRHRVHAKQVRHPQRTCSGLTGPFASLSINHSCEIGTWNPCCDRLCSRG